MKDLSTCIKNQKGSLTIDFLLASVLIMGVTGILFALSFTLTVVEITQYIAFATSRNYTAAHFNEESQENMAQNKYEQLTQETSWRNLYKKDGWFLIKHLGTKDYRDEYSSGREYNNDRFWGTKIELESKVLDFQIPFYGSTNPEDEKFTMNINSFLGREPTSEECTNFVEERLSRIVALDSKYNAVDPNENYARIYDNGC